MNLVTVLCLLFYVTRYVVLAKDKRVLLHSDQDLYQFISSMQTDMAALNSTLRAEVAKLTSSLQAETTLSSNLRTEVATLKSSLETEDVRTESLRSEVAILKASLQTETTRTSSLQAEVATLNSSLQSEVASRQAEVATMQSKIRTLETNIVNVQQTTGSIYVRWGRTSCPSNGTEMVYKGRMAGNKYTESGGGSNQVCLPDDPTWGKYVDGMTGYGTIYGTEIGEPDNIANALFGKPVQDQDVPCAVCRTTRPSNVMISGRATCYPGWTMEYLGYLASNHPTSESNADYVCLDSGLEFASHGAADDNEHIVKIVEVVCGQKGSLPCPPYVDGRELSCVVCSK